MGHKYAEIAFTRNVRDIQTANGSRDGYSAMDQSPDHNHLLSERETTFIHARDSFYMASVGETGWPYVQHRGGPIGFIKVLDARTIGFADYSGNRQFISTGNFINDDRVSLFFMDYPNRTRLKMFGRVRVIGHDEHDLLALLEDEHYRARIERGFIITVEAFDWNCPQHITPRYTEADIDNLLAPLIDENRQLKEAASSMVKPMTNVLGTGELELVVSGIRQLTSRVRAFELRAPNGSELPAVEAGAHLEIPIMLESGDVETRHYSIASNPARRDAYEIAVLREDDGTGGSKAVHNSYQIGMTIRTPQPANYFKLHQDNRPAVLIAGGIGITPIKAMAQALVTRGISMQLHYAGRSFADMPYRDRLQKEFAQKITLYSSAAGEHLDILTILKSVPENAAFYVCGPTRLIDEVLATAQDVGINEDRLRFERFSAEKPSDAKPVHIELARSGVAIQVRADQTILDAIQSEGVNIPHSCKAGNCKSCAVKVIQGRPDHRDSALSADERNEQHLMCPCVSRAVTDKLVLDI
ncbi:2Fe-2S iron-sulfur cluster-binding protein [Photobacterium kasasachensis]|uniref:2Fe-2S iron-sulfur cluster-binding protein n=1 Tax=Photobacterium kasasachensis TaxID=2910240 RepID=UPI003D14969F